MQRSGRVDRLNSPHATVYLVSFLPEDGLDRLLGLVDRLNDRFRLYRRLGLADEPVTRLPADQVVGVSLEQLRRLYRDDDGVLDDIERTWTLGSTDYMRTPLEAYLRAHAGEAIKRIPTGVQSVKALPADWRHGEGIFIAFAYGSGEQTETSWRFYPRTPGGWGPAVKDEIDIFRVIVCHPSEPRVDLPAHLDADGPVPGVDWDLLRRAAADLADEVTAVRFTAAVTQGASDRSARIRGRLLDALGDLDLPEVGDLLDRLEQVRVEDHDTDPRYEGLLERLRAAERADVPADRARALREVARHGMDLLGPVEEEDGRLPAEVRAEDLRLTAWEVLVRPERDEPRRPRAVEMTLDDLMVDPAG